MSGVAFKDSGGVVVQSKRWGLSSAFAISFDSDGMPVLAVSGAGGDHDIGDHQDTTFTSLAADEFMVRNPGNTAWVNRDIANADIPATLTNKTLSTGCTWSGNAIPWTSVSKTGSTLASLETRLISSTTGTLTVGRGGTNSSGFTDEQLLYYDSGSASILSSGVARTQVARLDVTSGLQTFQTRIAITNTQVGTVALAVTGDPYLSTVTTIATFVGDSDGLRIQNVLAGDYRISNMSGVGGAITFYDSTSGLRLRYSSTDRLAVDSAGGITILSGGLRTTSHGEVITQAGGWTGDAIGGAYIGSHNHDAGDITTGILAVSRGGTGQSAFTNGEVVYTVGGDLQSWKHIDYVAQLDKTSEQVFTGNLQIDKASPAFVLDRDATSEWVLIEYQSGGSDRWKLAMENNTGGDFMLRRFNDAGVYQDSPLIIDRSTGNANLADLAISNGGTITSGTWNGTAIASGYIGSHSHDAGDIGSGILGTVRGGTGSGSVYSAGDVVYYIATGFQGWKHIDNIAQLDLSTEQAFSGNIAIDKASPTLRMDRSATTQNILIRYENVGVLRWQFGTASDAAADWGIYRYNDVGTYQDRPLILYRSTGNANIADLAISNGGTITSGTWTGSVIGSAYIGSHNHDATDITSGKLAIARGGTNWDGGYSEGFVIRYFGGRMDDWIATSDVTLLSGVQTISGVKTYSTYWTSSVAVSGTIYAWGGTGYTACKRITTQGGFSLGCDSCMLLHAGDNTDNLVSELSITAGYTGENVFITADTQVYIITGRQAGVYPTYTKMFTFLNTGNFDMSGTIVNATWGGAAIGFSVGGHGGYSWGVAHDEELVKYDHGSLQFQPSGLDLTYVAMTNQAEVWSENLRVSGAQALVNLDDDGTVGSSYYCDWGDSNVHKVQISASITIYVGSGSSCHPLPGGEYHLVVRAGGNYTLTINGVNTWFSPTSSPFVMTSGTVLHFFFTCVDDVGSIILHGWASEAKTGLIN